MNSFARATRVAAIVSLGMVASPAAVLAADLAPDYPVIDTPEPMPLPGVGGWYLRGDIGYKLYADPSGSMSNPSWGDNDLNVGNGLMRSESLGGAADIGVGVGYKFNDYLRVDATLDYETPAQFKGSLYCVTAGDPCNGGDWVDSERAKISAWSGLLNGYVDLGTFEGFTPYVGAGAGVSYLKTSGIHSSNKDGFTGANAAGAGEWNLAWALMAGVSYAINENLSLDVGYRYLNLGDAKTGYITERLNDGSAGATTRMNYENIQAHEVRVGLRYYLP